MNPFRHALGLDIGGTKIALGGGQVDAHSEFFLEAARAAARHAHLISRSAVEVLLARLGNQAGLVGTARWAIERGIASIEHTGPTSSPLLASSP